MEKIDQILESLYDRVIEPMEAKEQLLDLFTVSNQSNQLLCPECLSNRVLEHKDKFQCRLCWNMWAK